MICESINDTMMLFLTLAKNSYRELQGDYTGEEIARVMELLEVEENDKKSK